MRLKRPGNQWDHSQLACAWRGSWSQVCAWHLAGWMLCSTCATDWQTLGNVMMLCSWQALSHQSNTAVSQAEPHHHNFPFKPTLQFHLFKHSSLNWQKCCSSHYIFHLHSIDIFHFLLIHAVNTVITHMLLMCSPVAVCQREGLVESWLANWLTAALPQWLFFPL